MKIILRAGAGQRWTGFATLVLPFGVMALLCWYRYLGQLAELAVREGELAELLDRPQVLLIVARVGLVHQPTILHTNMKKSIPEQRTTGRCRYILLLVRHKKKFVPGCIILLTQIPELNPKKLNSK